MLETYAFGMGTSSRPDTTKIALDAYRRSLESGKASRVFGIMTGRRNQLAKLEAADGKGNRSQHEAGLQSVPIRLIRGTEGRSGDFDRNFHPLSDKTRDRWLSIYRAEADGLEMPAVELIRKGDCYYVRDGHHRISVARSMGREYVDARVIAVGD